MVRELLKLDDFKFRNCTLSYALWSDGIIEKVVTKKKRVVFYKEIKVINDAIGVGFDVVSEELIVTG